MEANDVYLLIVHLNSNVFCASGNEFDDVDILRSTGMLSRLTNVSMNIQLPIVAFHHVLAPPLLRHLELALGGSHDYTVNLSPASRHLSI